MSTATADPNPNPAPSPSPAADPNPNPSPAADPNPAPAADPSPAPEGSSTQPEKSASPEELAEQARRDAVPEAPTGYEFKPSEKVVEILGDLGEDRAINALREVAKEKGWTQGQFEDRVTEVVNALAEKGLFEPMIDLKAETAALGTDGAQRQAALLTRFEALKARGDIDGDMQEELAMLVSTAAGTKALEFLLRGAAPVDPNVDGANVNSDPKEEAKALRRDPRYGKDRAFTKEADAKWLAAFPGSR